MWAGHGHVVISTVVDDVELFVGCWRWGKSLWVDGSYGCWCVDCDLDSEAAGDGSGSDMASPCGIGSSLFDTTCRLELLYGGCTCACLQ